MNPDQGSNDTSDDALLARIRSGDEAALTALYRRYVASIHRFILAQVRNVGDAEDLTSETFARMLHGFEQFRGEASFKNWLYQIARNAVRNHRRAAHYRLNVALPPTLAAGEEEPAGDEGAAEAHQAEVLRLLQPLPPRYRQILELRFLMGRTIEDVAAEMQITVGNAKVLQHRALKKAAAVLDEQPNGPFEPQIAASGGRPETKETNGGHRSAGR